MATLSSSCKLQIVGKMTLLSLVCLSCLFAHLGLEASLNVFFSTMELKIVNKSAQAAKTDQVSKTQS